MRRQQTPSTPPLTVTRKLAVLGFRAVGKTSLTTQFVSSTFHPTRYDPTIENVYHKVIRFRRVHFDTVIVDTAGMDEFSHLSRNASVGVHGYVMVYSICDRTSFVRLQQINEGLLNILGDLPDVPRVLVGSMRDLGEPGNDSGGVDGSSGSSREGYDNSDSSVNDSNSASYNQNQNANNYGSGFSNSSHRQVSTAEARALADSWGVPFLECSSKTGVNIREVFHVLLKEIEKDGDLLGFENEGNGGCVVL